MATTTYRYSVTNGLAGLYMPDNVCLHTGTTRRELASTIRYELEFYDMPASLFKQADIRSKWAHIKRYGSSSLHFSFEHEGYELAFHGLTEDEANQMEAEND